MSTKPKSRRSRHSLSRMFNVWLSQHGQAFFSSLGDFFRSPVSSLLLTAVIGISLALPTAFYLILDNAQRVMDTWQGSVRIALYLKPSVSEEQARTLAGTLEEDAAVESVRFISREEALQEYRQMSGFDDVLEALEENPLPPVLVITPGFDSLASGGEAMLDRLNNLEQVDMAQYDSRWIKRLLAILEILQRGVLILSALLAVAVALIIGNSIRLTINNRRTEIEVNKLFGATNAFVQRPFLYSGLIHGVGGGLLAWILVAAALMLLDTPIERLAGLYHSDFRLHGLHWREFGLLLLAGAVLGISGSWLAVQRQLRELDLF
ncbi:MAG: permease-like cell division protein FtsX [Gammaproteobacteria bacterium]